MESQQNLDDISKPQNQVGASAPESSADALIKHQQKAAAERIRKRDSEDLKNNFNRSVKGIYDFYIEKQTQLLPKGLRSTLKLILKKYLVAKLEHKADLFGKEFESTVFSNIIHFTDNDLGLEVQLKSPSLLAKEKGVLLEEIPTHTNLSDVEIGNDRYVFARSPLLWSRYQAAGKYAYKIESEEGDVVPIDIADLKSDNPLALGYDYKCYADNVYAFADFKRLFSLYCAAVFPSSEEAIKVLKLQGDQMFYDFYYWLESVEGYPDSEIRLKMRNLLSRARVYPPISPEFQFKDKVMAKRIDNPKLTTYGSGSSPE